LILFFIQSTALIVRLQKNGVKSELSEKQKYLRVEDIFILGRPLGIPPDLSALGGGGQGAQV